MFFKMMHQELSSLSSGVNPLASSRGVVSVPDLEQLVIPRRQGLPSLVGDRPGVAIQASELCSLLHASKASTHIFVHSLWRSASIAFTAITAGQVKSAQPLYHALNPALADTTIASVRRNDGSMENKMLRYPHMNRHLSADFPFEKGRIKGYETTLAFRPFSLEKEAQDDRLQGYMCGLLRSVEQIGKRAIIQTNLSSLRESWMKSTLNGVHIFLTRNPEGILQSALGYFVGNEESRRVGGDFLAYPLMILGLNRDDRFFGRLAQEYDVPPYTEEKLSLSALRELYYPKAAELSEQDHRDLVVALWTGSLADALRSADLIIDVDQLGTDESYRGRMELLMGRLIGSPLSYEEMKPLAKSNSPITVSPKMHGILSEFADWFAFQESRLDSAVPNAHQRSFLLSTMSHANSLPS